MQEAIIRKETASPETLMAGSAAEREAIEAEMGLLEERLDALFAAIPAGIAIVDNNFRYLHVSDSLARINGISVKDHLGKSIHEVVPLIAPLVEPTLKRIIKTGKPALNIELTGETASEAGAIRHWLTSFVPLFGKDGSLRGLGALVVEVTNLKHVEDALGESEARLRMLMELSLDAVLVLDVERNVIDVNRRASEMLGYTREELIQLNARDLISAEDLVAAPARIDDLLEGRLMSNRRCLRRKDGTTLRAEVVGSVVGGNNRMQIVAREIVESQLAHDGAGNNGAGRNSATSSAKASFLKQMSVALAIVADALEHGHTLDKSLDLEIGDGINFYDEVSRFEIELIERALRQAGGRQKTAAQLLGIKQTTLHAMIKRYKINISEPSSD